MRQSVSGSYNPGALHEKLITIFASAHNAISISSIYHWHSADNICIGLNRTIYRKCTLPDNDLTKYDIRHGSAYAIISVYSLKVVCIGI